MFSLKKKGKSTGKSPAIVPMHKKPNQGGFFDSRPEFDEMSSDIDDIQLRPVDLKTLDLMTSKFTDMTHGNAITDIQLSNKYVFTSSVDKHVIGWSKRTWCCKFTLIGHTDAVQCIKLVSEQLLISGGDDGTVRIWKFREKQPLIGTISVGDKIVSIEIHPLEQLILVGTNKGKLIGIDWNTKRVVETFKARQHHLKQINFIYCHDEVVYTSSSDSYVKAWNIEDGSLLSAHTFSQPIFKISSLGELFFVSQYTNVGVCDMKEDWASKPPFLSICDFTIVDRLLIGWNRSHAEMELWDIDTRQLLHKQKIDGAIFLKKIQYDPTSGTVYFALSNFVDSIQFDVKKVNGITTSEILCPIHVKYANVYDYCVSTLMFPSESVVKALEECHEKGTINIKENDENNTAIVSQVVLISLQSQSGILLWRRPLENFFFVVTPSNFRDSKDVYNTDQLKMAFGDKVSTFYKIVPPESREFILHMDSYKDAFEMLCEIAPEDLRKRLNVSLNNEPTPLADFYYLFWKNASIKYFSTNSDNSHHIKVTKDPKCVYRSIGRLLGQCIYQRELPIKKIHLSRALLKMITGKPIVYEDLESVEKVNFWNTEQILKESDVSLLGLKFPKTDDAVTEKNKHEYITLIVKNNIYTIYENQIDEFLIGLYEVIPKSYYKIFDEYELEILLFGSGLDKLKDPIADWETHTKYGNGYSGDSQTIGWFWQILSNYDGIKRAKVLQYSTGTTAIPKGGFVLMDPKFQICKLYTVENGIIAHGDMNRLDIPEYQTKSDLEVALARLIKI
jgi:WD40 repeat protein